MSIKLPMLNHRNVFVRIAGYILYVFIALFLFLMLIPPNDDGPKDNSPGNDTLDTDDVKQMLPWGIDAKEVYVEGGNVYVTLPEKAYLDEAMYMRNAKRDSAEIFKELFKDPRVKKATVNTEIGISDAYGHTRIETGASYTMTAQTARKIDWNNFMYPFLDTVADNVYINPIVARGLT
jgi:hypothetical protein